MRPVLSTSTPCTIPIASSAGNCTTWKWTTANASEATATARTGPKRSRSAPWSRPRKNTSSVRGAATTVMSTSAATSTGASAIPTRSLAGPSTSRSSNTSRIGM